MVRRFIPHFVSATEHVFVALKELCVQIKKPVVKRIYEIAGPSCPPPPLRVERGAGFRRAIVQKSRLRFQKRVYKMDNKPEFTKTEQLCPKKTIAAMFNLSERRIEQLVKDRIIPKAARGVFDLVPTVQAYVRYLQGLAGGGVSAEIENLERRLLMAQTLEREAKARQAEYQADVMEGKLLKLEDVARQWTSRYVEVKAAMLEFPKRVAFRFTDPEVRLRVEEEANAFVVELLERYSREGILPDGPLGSGTPEEGPSPSEGDDGERMGEREQDP